MSRSHAPAGLAGFIGGIALAMTALAILAGNGGKYLAQYSHTNSVAHLSPVERDANASGSGFSSLPGSLATYSGEDK